MQCERCKAELLPDAKFCPECGQIVVQGQQESASSPAVASLENRAEEVKPIPVPEPLWAQGAKPVSAETATPPAFVPVSHSIPSPALGIFQTGPGAVGGKRFLSHRRNGKTGF